MPRRRNPVASAFVIGGGPHMYTQTWARSGRPATAFSASVPYAFALGAFVAVLDLIPLVGATMGTVIAVAVALATRGVWTAVIVVVAMLIYQQIENNVLQPLVYHRTVKISPLAIAVSVAVGVELAGVIGALLAIPFAGTLKVVGREVIAWRRGEETPT
jgi:predicted PurR-regulated permease PerM